MNNPALSWVHYHLGVIRPYLPEFVRPDNTSLVSWRASELPSWSDSAEFNHQQEFDPPAENHRWLPLDVGSPLDGTPITITAYHPHGSGWTNWAIAAQEHYSLLEHIEKEELEKYDFDTWDYQYDRLSINMIAIWGDDIVDNRPGGDDEYFLTVELPNKLGRRK